MHEVFIEGGLIRKLGNVSGASCRPGSYAGIWVTTMD